MKNTKFALIFAISILFINVALAQKTIIKYAPLTNFGVERVISEKNSIYIGATIGSSGSFGGKAEYRFYGLLRKQEKSAPEGFWVAPQVAIGSVVFDDFYDKERALVATAGGLAGYQWIFKNKITLEPALGLGVMLIGGNNLIGGLGFLAPLGGIRIGYAIN